MSDYRNENELSLRDLVILGVAFMTPIIPAFLYFTEAAVVNGVAASSAIFAFGAILITIINFKMLYQEFPSSGSVFTFASYGIHPYAGFIAGWVSLLFYILAPVCAILMSAQVINSAIPSIPSVVFIVILIAFTAIANFFGIKRTAKTLMLIFLISLALVIIYILVCFISAGKGMGVGKIISLQPFMESGFKFTSLLSASALLCLAFLGFESSSLYTSEAENPKENVNKALTFSCIIIGIAIFLQAYSSELVVLHDESIIFSLETIAQKTGAGPMRTIYAIAIIISGILVGIAGQAASNRMLTFMGKHEAIPHSIFGRTRVSSSMPPLNQIIVLVIVLVLCLLPFKLVTLEQIMIFGGSFILLITNVTALVYYYFKKNGNNIINSLVLPAIGFFYTLYMWISVAPKQFLFGIIWIALGAAIVVARHFLGVRPVTIRLEDGEDDYQESSYRSDFDRPGDVRYADDWNDEAGYENDGYDDGYGNDGYGNDGYGNDYSLGGFDSKWTGEDEYADEGYLGEGYTADKFATDKFATDKFATDKFATDKFATDKYSGDLTENSWPEGNTSSNSMQDNSWIGESKPSDNAPSKAGQDTDWIGESKPSDRTPPISGLDSISFSEKKPSDRTTFRSEQDSGWLADNNSVQHDSRKEPMSNIDAAKRRIREAGNLQREAGNPQRETGNNANTNRNPSTGNFYNGTSLDGRTAAERLAERRRLREERAARERSKDDS